MLFLEAVESYKAKRLKEEYIPADPVEDWDDEEELEQCYMGNFVEYIAKEGTMAGMSRFKRENPLFAEKIVIENHHEAIVSKEDFERAALCMKKVGQRKGKGKAKAKEKTALRGKVNCSHCGYSMVRTETKLKNITMNHAYYRCSNSEKEMFGCSRASFREDAIERIILEELRGISATMIEVDEILQKALRQQKKEEVNSEATLEQLQKQIVGLRSKKMDLYDDYKDGKIGKKQYMLEKQEAEDSLKDVNESIVGIEVKQQAESVQVNENHLIKRFKNYNLEEVNSEMIQEFVERVRIFDGSRVEIEWKFADEFEKVAKVLEEGKGII